MGYGGAESVCSGCKRIHVTAHATDGAGSGEELGVVVVHERLAVAV